jgi:hypothetical protein
MIYVTTCATVPAHTESVKEAWYMGDTKGRPTAKAAGGGGVYFLGMIGSVVFFVQQAHGFWPVVLAFFKALVWPAFMIYDVFKYIS